MSCISIRCTSRSPPAYQWYFWTQLLVFSFLHRMKKTVKYLEGTPICIPIESIMRSGKRESNGQVKVFQILQTFYIVRVIHHAECSTSLGGCPPTLSGVCRVLSMINSFFVVVVLLQSRKSSTEQWWIFDIGIGFVFSFGQGKGTRNTFPQQNNKTYGHYSTEWVDLN